ncbi:MAG: Hsp20/alpha crystallin family protein [Candidatus Omnitrophica bacterium]|nr:Hsp20/alpha crystallin family protein [Candidatus Omnitrophota bacterium]MCF7893863.1 Hsp20/alpha crystallin family protein [Candidatus Omnitrophota bacterium]
MKLAPYHQDDPFRLLRDFGKEIDSFFESPFKGITKKDADFALPSLDISEDKDNIYVDADLPGFEQKDVKVKMKKDSLVISASKDDKSEEKKKNYYHCERYQGSFYREVALPQAINDKNIKASYKNGVLKVTLPKSKEEKEKEISIDVK